MPKYNKLVHTHYGLTVYETTDGYQYAVGTDKQATKAASEYIRGSIWAFNSDFLEGYVPVGVTADVLTLIQDKCESGNEALLELVGKRIKKLTNDAIAADGRGHFLSGYDGSEIDSDDVEGLPKGKVAFRI